MSYIEPGYYWIRFRPKSWAAKELSEWEPCEILPAPDPASGRRQIVNLLGSGAMEFDHDLVELGDRLVAPPEAPGQRHKA